MTRKPLAEQMQAAHKAVSGWDGCASAGGNGAGLPVEYGRRSLRIWQ